jgi:hypothetical protein
MNNVFIAPLAKFAQFQAIFQSFLVFVALIPSALAILAFEFDEVFL